MDICACYAVSGTDIAWGVTGERARGADGTGGGSNVERGRKAPLSGGASDMGHDRGGGREGGRERDNDDRGGGGGEREREPHGAEGRGERGSGCNDDDGGGSERGGAGYGSFPPSVLRMCYAVSGSDIAHGADGVLGEE
eukprot:1992783-Rhodomonas_salina.1